MVRPGVLSACMGALPGVVSQLPPFTPELRDKLWKQAEAEVKKMKSSEYVGQGKYACASGTWGDGPQCNEWDAGFSPCWPSAMTISASWDVELMALWSRHMAMEFGVPNRGHLAPGVNLARYPWNGRLGEYISGEDPYFGARMVESMVTAYRDIDKPPLQTVKHFIPNTIEVGRMDFTEVVDERTLFEVYYPAFQAAVDAGMSAVMCSYNLVHCTSGMCDTGPVYACANNDILEKHLKGVMGFKGIVISDWEATKCQATAAETDGCKGNSYVDGKYAAKGGLDLEMPGCQSLSGGFTDAKMAAEKATRTRWAYLVQGRTFDKAETGENKGWFSDSETHEAAATADAAGDAPAAAEADAPSGDPKELPKGPFCCFWPTDGKDACTQCQSFEASTKAKCAESETNLWCVDGKAHKLTAKPAPDPAKASPRDPPTPDGGKPVKSAAEGAKKNLKGEFCCFWPTDSEDVCGGCGSFDAKISKEKCAESDTNVWCVGGTATKMATSPADPPSTPDSSTTAPTDDDPPATPPAKKGSAKGADAKSAGGFCCYWASDDKDDCSSCQSKSQYSAKVECEMSEQGTWCEAEAGDTAARELAGGAAPAGPGRRGTAPAAPEAERRLKTKTAPKKSATDKLEKLGMCPFEGADNYKQPCRLELANRIIAESSVVLKNEGGVLPISKKSKVALVGSEACSTSPLAIGGGSGWNGMACQETYISVEAGISNVSGAAAPSCLDNGGDAASADVVVIVVVPEKAEEGRDRSTLQLEKEDVELIKKYSKMDTPVVVVMNAPGPMITSTWDEGVDAVLMTWLPGTQNGAGIAKALYNDGYEASGRLPFTFPKCSSEACTKKDEFDGSIPLGDQIKNKKYWTLTDRALVGYRWYHANDIEPNYPFGYGLFAYGSGSVEYKVKAATPSSDGATVQVSLSQDGKTAGKDVPQLYLKFPDSVPGEPEIRPEWVLKGFAKVLVEPGKATEVTFNLTSRDLSYWDDSKGASQWVCASGEFTACVGANARDAVKDDQGPGCAKFTAKCDGAAPAAKGPAKGAAEDAVQKDSALEELELFPARGSVPRAAAGPAAVAAAAVALAAAALQVVRRSRRAAGGAAAAPSGESSDQELLAGGARASAPGGA